MAAKETYFAVFARIEDGKIVHFDIDGDALVGSYDGYVWDEETQEWSNDEPEATPNPYAVLRDMLDSYEPISNERTTMNTTTKIQEALSTAVSIATDGCHKIYVNADETQHKLMASYGYDPLYRIDAIGGPDAALAILRQWWDESCGLRFISLVRTVPGDPNEGFTNLIAQGADWEG